MRDKPKNHIDLIMSQRIQKRVKKVVKEFEETVVDALNIEAVSTRPDESLFTLDRTGSKAAKRRVTQEILPQHNKEFVSQTEKKLIQRALVPKPKPYGKYISKIGSDEARDLWGDSTEEVEDSDVVQQKKKVRVALPGQSYNPAARDHQDAIAEAVALQLKKEEAERTKSNPQKMLTRNNGSKVMDLYDIGTVPLSDELGGGLRAVLPKGTALTLQANSMVRSGDVVVPGRRNRRSYEKPHAPKRIAWHAKYKYN